MTDAVTAVHALNQEAAKWELRVSVNNDTRAVAVYVAGTVYLAGRKRGQRRFFGSVTSDPAVALVSGMQQMRAMAADGMELPEPKTIGAE